MSKLFNGNYVRLDDDVSFHILRTNPRLTTNTKLMYDGQNMFMEAYPANPLLSTLKYKNVFIKGNTPFNSDIRRFLQGTGTGAYDVYQEMSDIIVSDTYDKQFETMYWSGAEAINSARYPQELGFIAPLYLRKKLPNYFVIFKIESPTSYNLNYKPGTNEVIDDEFVFEQDVLKNATIVKTFDLREGTVIGNYIRKYTEQQDFEYDKSIYVNFSSHEITYYGIDKSIGVLTSKVENFDEEMLKKDGTILHDDDWITAGFERNNLIFPYIINFEFLFDDNDTKDYKFARYFGMYCNDIDLFDFEAYYVGNGLDYSDPTKVISTTLIHATDEKKIGLVFNEKEDLTKLEFNDNTIYYLKDKHNTLHRVVNIEKNLDTLVRDDYKLEITDKFLDLSTVCGFETSNVSSKCERVSGLGSAKYAFTVKKMFEQGDTIRLYNDIRKRNLDYDIFASEDEGNDEYITETHLIGEFVADSVLKTEDDGTIVELPAGENYGKRFSINGSIDEMLTALCNAVNSVDPDNQSIEAFHNSDTIVFKAIVNGSNYNSNLKIEFDESMVKNKKIILDHGKKYFEGGTDVDGCLFKISKDDVEQFSKDRFLKSYGDKPNARITSCTPYIDPETGQVSEDYYEVSTDNNGIYVSLSYTNDVVILDRYYPKVGMLSFFPIKDFDFDTIYSTYGLNTAFKKECDKLDKKRNVFNSKNKMIMLASIAGNRFVTDDGVGLDNEYDYYMENILPELCTVNKTVPNISKWGYYDDQKDSCENPYRLNFNKIFGTCNLSSNTYTRDSSVSELTHSMPYYLTVVDVNDEIEDTVSKITFNEDTGESDDVTVIESVIKSVGMDYMNEYQYVYDSIGVYNSFVSKYRNDKTTDVLSDDEPERVSEFTAYSNMWIAAFMDTETNNFDKLFVTKTKEFNSKRFDKKYSRFKFGNDNTFSNTLFRGVKFNVKKIVNEHEIHASDYNDYKFSFLYIPIDSDSPYSSNRVFFVKNDTFKFIVGIVFFNTLSGISMSDPDKNDSEISSNFSIKDFGKAYVYGGCYNIIENPFLSSKKLLEITSGQVITQKKTKTTLDNIPVLDVFDVKVSGKTIDASRLVVNDDSLRLMIYNLNDKGCISKLRFHDKDEKYVKTYNRISTKGNVIYVDGDVYSTDVYNDGNILVDITFNDIIKNIGTIESPEYISVMYQNYYSIFENTSTYCIKHNINENENVSYYNTGDDVYRMSIEDPTSINTYDLLKCTPISTGIDDKHVVDSAVIEVKNNTNDIKIVTLNRYSGYYNPIFTDIVQFDDLTEEDRAGNSVTHKYSNVTYDIDYVDNYGKFGFIKNVFFHKTNEYNANNIISTMTPYYPSAGQYALDYRDYNIFESNWDKDYYTKQLDLKHSERVAGTLGIRNNPCMFGSKYMNLPEEVTIDTFNSSTDWDDDYISDQYATKHDVMFKEVNNKVIFYLFLYKRIVRYFAEESPLKDDFVKFINPEFSYKNKTTINDDLNSYIETNVMKLYKLDNIKIWVRRKKSGSHDKDIENDYETYIVMNNDDKKKNNLQRIGEVSIQKVDSDLFNRKVTYNMRTGYKEDFGFSFIIKKI